MPRLRAHGRGDQRGGRLRVLRRPPAPEGIVSAFLDGAVNGVPLLLAAGALIIIFLLEIGDRP